MGVVFSDSGSGLVVWGDGSEPFLVPPCSSVLCSRRYIMNIPSIPEGHLKYWVVASNRSLETDSFGIVNLPHINLFSLGLAARLPLKRLVAAQTDSLQWRFTDRIFVSPP